MRTTFYDKKYRISLNYRIESGLAGEFIEIDNLDELKIYLLKELVSRISLKYWNNNFEIEPKWYIENIPANQINEEHFRWLVNESENESRWIMAEDKLEKNYYL